MSTGENAGPASIWSVAPMLSVRQGARAVEFYRAAFGAEVEEGYGWRVGRIVDPFAHHWEIGQPLAS